MDLRQLRYFAAVATELSFTKAAERLHISQPPLSHQIGVLEEELGVRLLLRTSRSVQLSDAGKALLPHALAVFERLEEARLHVARIKNGFEGRVVIGLTGSHFLGPLPSFIQMFRQQRPAVELVLQEMAPKDQLAALAEGRIDLSFSRGIPEDPSVHCTFLWPDAVVAALPLNHALARRRRVHLRELQHDDFVFLRLGSSLFSDAVYQACIAAQFQPRIVQQVVEVPAAVNLVAAGIGVAIVPASIARLRSDAIAICRLAQPEGRTPISADVYVARRAEEERPLVLLLAQALTEWASQLPTSPLA